MEKGVKTEAALLEIFGQSVAHFEKPTKFVNCPVPFVITLYFIWHIWLRRALDVLFDSGDEEVVVSLDWDYVPPAGFDGFD
jgi:hypothetical protein